MRLALAQLNPTVGDIAANADLVAAAASDARGTGADLLVTPELVLCGYPPRDLLLQPGFVDACEAAVSSLARRIADGPAAVVGAPLWRDPRDPSAGVINALAVLDRGAVRVRYAKRLLPAYDVFDENRYFVPGNEPAIVEIAGRHVGLAVCEDLWHGEDAGAAPRYQGLPDPLDDLAAAGAEIIVNPSASPFSLAKLRRQRAMLARLAGARSVVIAAVNQLGGNDELIFAGAASVHVPDPSAPGGARLLAAGRPFEDAVLTVDLGKAAVQPVVDPVLEASDDELLWKALTLGVRDYCRKTGLRAAVLGLSGGVDSSLVACIAAAALGSENVLAISMPSRFSSEGSRTDAAALAEAVGLRLITLPIETPHAYFEELLGPAFQSLAPGAQAGVAEENVQSRIRGLLVMALANKLGRIALSTGNKSELAVGYCTLYGDMNGGLAVIADLTKRQVYSLCRHINAEHRRCGFARPPVPPAVLTKPPSAELRPHQKDQDSLPPYDELDEILDRYVSRRQGAAQIQRETGFSPEVVQRAVRLIDAAEHKRRQSPPALKVSDVAFGIGRRMPIAQRWRAADY